MKRIYTCLISALSAFVCSATSTVGLLPQGDGSESSPWLISSANDWISVAQYAKQNQASFAGEYFRLTADIDFSTMPFQPICQDGTTYFEGIFDGNAKTISGINYENQDSKAGPKVGLFGMTGPNAQIYNLTLAESNTIKGYQYVGAVSGYGSGKIYGIINKANVSSVKIGAAGIIGYATANAEIYNCINYGTITALTTAGGGIIGTSDADVKIHSCQNYGYITSAGSTGGIIGVAKSSISNCKNFGEVYSSVANAGGIVGYMFPPASSSDNIVSDCENHGLVTTKTSVAGGIVGLFNTPSLVKRCTNYQAVTATTFYAGGIAGSFQGKLVSIDSCVNYGKITTGTYGAGGILGTTVDQKSNKNSRISNVVNYGNIKAGKYSAGGIAGVAKYYVIIENAFNYCDSVISEQQYAAGIVGNGGAAITNAFNRAYIQGTYSCGGIVGSNEASLAYNDECIHNAINIGNVHSTGTSAVTGYRIGGILGYGRVNIENVFNFADISGPSDVAGIVGYPYAGTTVTQGKILNAIHVGRVKCSLPEKQASTGMVFSHGIPEYVDFENLYYDKQMAGSLIYTVDESKVTGLTTQQLMNTQPGSAFQIVQKSYPQILTMKDSLATKLATAVILLADDENCDNISSPFHAYCSDGSWEGENFTFHNHGLISWSGITIDQLTPITAVAGNLSHTVMLKFTKTTHVDAPFNADPNIIERQFYTIDGIKQPQPNPHDGKLYLIITTYTDGSKKISKHLNQ